MGHELESAPEGKFTTHACLAHKLDHGRARSGTARLVLGTTSPNFIKLTSKESVVGFDCVSPKNLLCHQYPASQKKQASDRGDQDLFKYVLAYHRDRKIILPPTISMAAVQQELKRFNLDAKSEECLRLLFYSIYLWCCGDCYGLGHINVLGSYGPGCFKLFWCALRE